MPTALLAGTVQPGTLTLLSTEGEPAISPLWRVHEGVSSGSIVTVLDDKTFPRVDGGDGAAGAHVPKRGRGGNLRSKVVHLQSPMIGDTYIEIGGRDQPLGAEQPWLGAQIRRLGARRFAIEATVVDGSGRHGRIRLESWRTEPTLLARKTPPLLRLPLALPQDGTTEWAELVVDLAKLLPLFRQLRPEDPQDGSTKRPRLDGHAAHHLPEGRFASVAAVRVYANCRVRRVWLADAGGVRGEWALEAAET